MTKKNDGKWLETLVEMAEQHAESVGATIQKNHRVYDEDGDNIAELDILITREESGRTFKWLIECRDRKSNGREGISWIEQLSTRRRRLDLDKVTAVSSSGFARTAKKLAKSEGVELREVHALKNDSFDDWLHMTYFVHGETKAKLNHATLFLVSDSSQELNLAVREILVSADSESRILRHSESGESVRVCDAFAAAATNMAEVQEALKPNARPIPIQLDATYPQDRGHYIVDTNIGPATIGRMLFFGQISLSEIRVPLERTAEYRGSDQRIVSRVAAFKEMEILGVRFALELHRMGKTDETFVILRRTSPRPRKQSARRAPRKKISSHERSIG